MAQRAPLLLKVSGEALKASGDSILQAEMVDRVCGEIIAGASAEQPVAVVVGGGNIMRGASLAGGTEYPAVGDYMGMLATLINALALRDGIRRQGGSSEVVAAHAIPNVAHRYERDQVMRWLEAGTIVVFGGGTGHPFFTTDTTAALRGAEIGAAAVLKGSSVDGVYSADPRKDASATRFDHLSFDQAVAGRYAIMDQTAFALCRERHLPIRVFDMTEAGAITAALGDNPPGTLISD
ncbi:MAG: uridine monophosphate kinase [Planctomycetota bacterium]|jgi:uridylate kinase|nr:uridine monophosphate kinase [Planctomycetota bacterium]